MVLEVVVVIPKRSQHTREVVVGDELKEVLHCVVGVVIVVGNSCCNAVRLVLLLLLLIGKLQLIAAHDIRHWLVVETHTMPGATQTR